MKTHVIRIDDSGDIAEAKTSNVGTPPTPVMLSDPSYDTETGEWAFTIQAAADSQFPDRRLEVRVTRPSDGVEITNRCRPNDKEPCVDIKQPFPVEQPCIVTSRFFDADDVPGPWSPPLEFTIPPVPTE